MKKVFSRWIHSLVSATTSDASSGKHNPKREKNSSAPKSKKLALEPLEDRNLLSASAITFNQLPDFTYQPSNVASILSFGLERTHFLSTANIGSSRGNDIVSVDRESLTVSVFLNNGGTSNQYSAPKTTVLSGIATSSRSRFAVADMNADGIDDLLVFYSNPVQSLQGGSAQTHAALYIDVHQGARNGSFSTEATTTRITNPFGFTESDSDFLFVSLQVRDVVADSSGKVHPDLLVTLQGTSRQGSGSQNTSVDKTFFLVGKDNGFETTVVTIPSSAVAGNAVAFGNFTTNSGSLQLISEQVLVPTDSKSVQTLNFYNATVSSSSVSTTAVGKREYSAATPLWTTTANVTGNAADEVLSGIHYANSSSQPTYAVRVSRITDASPFTNTSPSGSTVISLGISTIDTMIEPRYYSIGDFNNDGHKDILVSDGTSYQFIVGSSTGQFTAQSKIDSFAGYLATTVGDFDGDGYQDVLAVGEKQLMLLPGNPVSPYYGSGQVLLNFSAKANDAAFGDFNGDGLVDFVISHVDAGTTLTLYTGVTPGKGDLFRKFSMFEGTEAFRPSALAVGNFVTPKIPGALHQKDDLAVLYASGKSIVTFSFEGTSWKSQKTDIPSAVVHIAAGDFNNDQYDDIIVANETNGTVTILKNKMDGTFDLNAEPIRVGDAVSADTNSGAKPSYVATADINDDGRLDFAVLNIGNNEVCFFTQNVGGTFSANGATKSITNLNLKKASRNYQMIFEDFDRDGRIDLLVGVTATNEAVVFQNKGTQSGQFSTDRNWVQTSALRLDGPFVGFATGFKTGNKTDSGYAAKTPGIVIVSGNNIYRFENKTVSEMSPGIMEIVFREYLPGHTTALDSGQYETIPEISTGGVKEYNSQLTWLHEWGYYYMEVWGSTGSTADEISSFTSTINYDKTLFTSTTAQIQTTSNFTLGAGSKVDQTTGKIIVSGTSRSAGLGKDKYVLLFRIIVSPATNTSLTPTENVGIKIPEYGYAKPAASGFRFDSGTSQINGKNLVNLTDGEWLPVYPVIYDLNDDGIINASDYSAMINPESAWGRTVESANSINAKWDFSHSAGYLPSAIGGVVETSDRTLLIRPGVMWTKRGDILPHYLFPAAMPTYWPQLGAADADILEQPSADVVDAYSVYKIDANTEQESLVAVSGEKSETKIDAAFTEVSTLTTEVLPNDAAGSVGAVTAVSSSTLNFFTDDAVYRIDLAQSNALQLSELDTLGYVARTDSIFNSNAKRVDVYDRILGELYADEDEDALTLDEISNVYEYPFDSLLLNDKILAELV